MRRMIWVSMVAVFMFGAVSCQDPYREGRNMMARGDLEEAEQFFKKKLNSKPNDALLHNEMGLINAKMANKDQAIFHYSQAVHFKPDFPEAHYNLGTVYYKNADFLKAVDHFQSAIEQRPNYACAYNNMGLAYMRSGRFDEAFKSLEKAIEIEPASEEFKANLEYAQKIRVDAEKIMAEWEKAVRENLEKQKDQDPQAGGDQDQKDSE